MTNATFIYNPFAGRNSLQRARDVREACVLLQKAGISVTLLATSRAGNGEELARAAVEAGHDLIIACGGDGTIHEVINGMTPGGVPLAILPGGTANIVARELRIPGRIARAAKQLPGWRRRRVALGLATWQESDEIKRRYFVAVAGIGFDAGIIPNVQVASKLQWGILIYGWEALRHALQYAYPAFECLVNGETYSATFAVLQRSRNYAGWFPLARGPGLEQSRFACCFFQGRTRGRYLLYALGVLTRTHPWLSDVTRCEDCISVGAKATHDVPVAFELDGELTGCLPATFEIVPNALTLLAP